MRNIFFTSSFGIILLAFFFSCTPYFKSANFDTLTAGHTKVAVVPFEMIFTGVKPDQLTEADIFYIEEAESQAFQISFYNEILRSTKRGKKALRVDIQHYQATLKLLEKEGVSIRSSWEYSPQELADLLGVDAVVRARIEKARFMSDLASYGIELSVQVINILTNYQLLPWLPMVSTQNKAITADFSLFEQQEGLVLWSINFDKGADWQQPANEIIDQISRRAAKKFPYRSSRQNYNL